MKNLLQDAKYEIETLRRRNEILQAKVEKIIDVIAQILAGKAPERRVRLHYTITKELHDWLQVTAKREGRSVIRQVEKILDDALKSEVVK